MSLRALRARWVCPCARSGRVLSDTTEKRSETGISPRVLLQVFVRSLALQLTWNDERMQNLGFAFAMAPALRALYPDPEARDDALRRHLELFNTHPYLAVLVLGVSVHMEEVHVREGHGPVEAVSSFKSGTMGGFGALGDGFFWGSLRPACVTTAAVGVLLGHPLFAVVGAWLFYFCVTIAFRAWAFVAGYRLGPAVTQSLQRLNLPRLGKWLRRYCVVNFAVLTVGIVWLLGGLGGGFTAWVLGSGVLLTIYGALQSERCGISVSLLTYVTSAIAVLVSVVFS